MTSRADTTGTPLPPAPTTLEATGLAQDTIAQLALKTLNLVSETTGTDLSRRLGLLFSAIEPALEQLKQQQQCTVVGGAMLGGAAFRYRITDSGRIAASLFLRQNQYVGVAPVPVADYREYMRHVASARVKVTPARIRSTYSHLILSDSVLDEIGPAVNSGHSMLIYGPPGNGKTAIAHGVADLLMGEIAVPHAIEVDGHIIRVFDPGTHTAVETDGVSDHSLSVPVSHDHRWVHCKRPSIYVGGEFSLESLELTYDQRLGFYRAPAQLTANGGLLVVDDFGRQRSTMRDLLNRWMAPLENRADYLTLNSGLKFEIPFMVMAVFVTNLRPSELADELFLRRVRYKVRAQNPTREEFIRIFELACRERGLAFERSAVELVLSSYYAPRNLPLRGCHPRDLIEYALLLAEYLGRPSTMTAALLEQACRGYFVDDQE